MSYNQPPPLAKRVELYTLKLLCGSMFPYNNSAASECSRLCDEDKATPCHTLHMHPAPVSVTTGCSKGPNGALCQIHETSVTSPEGREVTIRMET